MPRYSQTHPQAWRQLQLREWLVAGRRFNASDAAEEFQVSRRTIMQDLEQMRALGHAIEYNYQTRSFELTEATGELPVPRIRKSELAAIRVAKEVLTAFGATPFAEAVDRVLRRVRELMPDLADPDLGTFSPSLSVLRGPAPETPLPWLEEFGTCIEHTQTVQIRYFTMYRDAESKRDVDPYRLVSRDGRGYLIAYCHTRQDVLIFRMDRIRAMEPLDRYFDVQEGFDLEAYLGSMFGIFKDKESYTVKVRFSPWVARWIKEDRWHDSQVMTDLPDGSLQVDLTVTGIVDVRRWILSFGGDAEVLEPEFLRRTVSDEVEKMQALYHTRTWTGDGASQRMRSTTLDDHEQ